MRNMRYGSVNLAPSPKKGNKVNKNINNHFIYNMSSEDRKVLSGLGNKQKIGQQTLERFMSRRKAKISGSVLSSTFSDMNKEKIKEVETM